MLKHGYHKIKETAILLAIPIDLLFDSQINFFWRLFSDCDIFSGLLWTRGEGQQGSHGWYHPGVLQAWSAHILDIRRPGDRLLLQSLPGCI